MIKKLDAESLAAACEILAQRDADMNFIFRAFGTPPLWARAPGFATLIHIILEQQVSLASALSAFNKLCEKVGEVTPEAVLNLSDEEMRDCYFSRQKTVYARDLAQAVKSGKLDLDDLENLGDEAVAEELKKIKGIGDWTADIYSLMALRRPDVMPRGDLALHVAWQKLKKSEHRPNSDEFLRIAERWKPHRATAARLLWHFYLETRSNRRQINLELTADERG